ncbi:MAG: FAD-dependent oxidoreductase [Actinobacteria bacterium]|nr:FAD-dependent oxidoreductase [Actinomycetota bacterium]
MMGLRVLIGMGTCGIASGAEDVMRTLTQDLERYSLEAEILQTGCIGLCYAEPLIEVIKPGRPSVFFGNLTPELTSEVVKDYLVGDDPRPDLAFATRGEGAVPGISRLDDLPVLKSQVRIALGNCGSIDPDDIGQYLATGGYSGLRRALLDMTPQGVIDEISRAGLRGRGGAGFSTGRKWQLCRDAAGSVKYAVCNADEGDPGAFMDRSILESTPQSVIEGLAIAGYAIGAATGYVYVRAEYPLAVKRLRNAVAQAEEGGFLGRDIFGSGFSFSVQVMEGAGAFVCGEETALLASIESKRGTPRPRPPFPAQAGLDGKPTIINNVKTLCMACQIIQQGADWFAGIGTENSRGTAVFALTGKIANSGLVEVAMGTPLSTIVYEIGGGIPRGKRLKAIQTGGPSGGCIPARLVDLPVDYDTLRGVGSIMGSGGMVVMDETACMVDVARYFLSFTQSESCGKCTACRLGTRQMLQILTRIVEGEGRDEDLETLLSVAKIVKECSLCGLGQTAPNPVISTLTHFRDEYEAHIKEKRCPAAVCDALMISPCQHTCPVGVNVPKYVAQIAAGDYEGAVATIRERNPFPSICGRICHHPCEGRCRRGELDAPVSIRSLKRFAADWWFDNKSAEPKLFPRTKHQKVAVVGAGPTGLSCAYFLAKMGYSVTVFEALPVAGGMLAVALPEFRLPAAVIQREVDYIAGCGVEIEYNTPINVNHTAEDLRRDGYDAVLIAAGAQQSQRIGIPGELEEIQGFHYGLRFLRDVRLGRDVPMGEKTAVIGGGNVALDAARTAVRLGSREVHVYYRRSRDEMPVSEVEYDEAGAEGVVVDFLVSPTRIVSEDWKVKGLECVRMALGEFDAGGRRRAVPIPGSEFFVDADTVIAAVGQSPDLTFLPRDSALERTRWETLVVDGNSLATNVPGIFAGGDFVTGPGMVIEAIAGGRRSALAIDKYLRGDSSRVTIYDRKADREIEVDSGPREIAESVELQPRLEVSTTAVSLRTACFDEIELNYSEQEAALEAGRCLRCDLD